MINQLETTRVKSFASETVKQESEDMNFLIDYFALLHRASRQAGKTTIAFDYFKILQPRVHLVTQRLMNLWNCTALQVYKECGGP